MTHATEGKVRIKEGTLQSLEWDAFVSRTPQRNVFSRSSWIRSISDVTGLSCESVTCLRGNEVVGVCPLFSRRRKTGQDLVIPPLTQYTTPCLLSPSVIEKHRIEQQTLAVTKALVDYIESRYERAAMVLHPKLTDIRSFLWNGWTSRVRYTYLLDLENMSEVEHRLSRDIPRQIRKAEKAGFYVKQISQFEEFSSMWESSHERQSATIPMSGENLTKLLCTLVQRGLKIELHLAYDSTGSPAAGTIFLLDEDEAFYWLGGAYPSYLQSGVNQLLFWNALGHLHQIGTKTVDFVGGDHPTIARYKSTFGGDLTPHFMVAKICSLKTRGIDLLRQILARKTVVV